MNLKIIENIQKQPLILEIVKLFRMVFFVAAYVWVVMDPTKMKLFTGIPYLKKI